MLNAPNCVLSKCVKHLNVNSLMRYFSQIDGLHPQSGREVAAAK